VGATKTVGKLFLKVSKALGRYGDRLGDVRRTHNISLSHLIRQALCFVAGTTVAMADGGFKAIESVELGDHVFCSRECPHHHTSTDGPNSPPLADSPVLSALDPALCRRVRLQATTTSGKPVQIELLRPIEWLALVGAQVDARMYLDSPELGFQGECEVVEVSACVQLTKDTSSGHHITGTFTTWVEDVTELSVGDLGNPIAGTHGHPFFSEARGWTALTDLRVGEQLRTATGTTEVIGLQARVGHIRVYNVEVDQAHSYYITDAMILVHNICVFNSKKAAVRSVVPGANAKFTKGPKPTFDKDLLDQGFKDTYYVETTNGKHVTVHHNPMTNEWADPHLSSGQ
jgi:hypothetical protein